MTAALALPDWRCLTLHQPWATAVAELLKGIETRSWATKYRGWVAMHAGSKAPAVLDKVGDWQVQPDGGGGWSMRHLPTAMRAGGGQNLLSTLFPAAIGKDYGYKVLPLGAVVAVARLVDVVPIGDPDDDPIRDGFAYVAANEELGDRWTREDGVVWVGPGQEPWGDYTPGRFAWLLADVHKLLEPIPAKGKQGLWKPDDELVAQLDAQIGAAA